MCEYVFIISVYTVLCTERKTIDVKIHRPKIWSVILYGSEALSLKVREEHRLKMFNNRRLKNIFDSKRGKVKGVCTMRSFMVSLNTYGDQVKEN
jgi:hypothetical protein